MAPKRSRKPESMSREGFCPEPTQLDEYAEARTETWIFGAMS
jgi:hypothetical protein